MKSPELYLYARNYGCRIRHYNLNGIEMLSMENSLIKVVFAVGKGNDIVELVHKPTDTDFLWHSFNSLENASHIPTSPPAGGHFIDTYAGGWQELFPTYGGPAAFRGGEVGTHGEACLYPWSFRILEDAPERIRVEFTLRTVRTPFLLTKTATITEDSARLDLRQRVLNLGSTEQKFMWGHHPAFGFPFLDASVELRVPGRPTVTVPQWAIAHRCPFAKETSGPWPILPDQDGKPFDMSRAHAFADKLVYEYAISDLSEGTYELVNHAKGLGIRMNWDLSVFKYVWVWGMYGGHEEYPWYGRAYTMGVEPWSSLPSDYEEACRRGDVLTIAPGETRTAWLSADLFQERS